MKNSEVLVVGVDYGVSLEDNTFILYRVEQKDELTMAETMEIASEAAKRGHGEWAAQSGCDTLDEFVTPALKAAGVKAELLDYMLFVFDTDVEA